MRLASSGSTQIDDVVMLLDVVTMYLRTTRTKTKSGPVEYVQLCHNYRHPETRVSRTEVIHSFGRADNLDIEQLRRLVNSIARYLPSEEAAQIGSELGDDWPFEYLGSRDVGGTWVLDRWILQASASNSRKRTMVPKTAKG